MEHIRHWFHGLNSLVAEALNKQWMLWPGGRLDKDDRAERGCQQGITGSSAAKPFQLPSQREFYKQMGQRGWSSVF